MFENNKISLIGVLEGMIIRTQFLKPVLIFNISLIFPRVYSYLLIQKINKCLVFHLILKILSSFLWF